MTSGYRQHEEETLTMAPNTEISDWLMGPASKHFPQIQQFHCFAYFIQEKYFHF
jgi:hypothetical protein